MQVLYTVLVCGSLATVYTCKGGMKAVICKGLDAVLGSLQPTRSPSLEPPPGRSAALSSRRFAAVVPFPQRCQRLLT